MIVFPGMLIAPAAEAGMPHPDFDVDAIDSDDEWQERVVKPYPHFAVFCHVQLCRAMTGPTEHWENAKIIAAIPDDEIRTMTFSDLAEAGVRMVIN